MSTMEVKIIVAVSWWVQPLLKTMILLCGMLRLPIDADKLAGFIAKRGIKTRVE